MGRIATLSVLCCIASASAGCGRLGFDSQQTGGAGGSAGAGGVGGAPPAGTITVTSPADGSVTNATQINVSGTLALPAPLWSFSINGLCPAPDCSANGSTWVFDNFALSREGYNTLTIVAEDKNGGVATKSIRVFRNTVTNTANIIGSDMLDLAPLAGNGSQNIAIGDFGSPGDGPPDGEPDVFFNHYNAGANATARAYYRIASDFTVSDFAPASVVQTMMDTGQGISLGWGTAAAPSIVEFIGLSVATADDQLLWWNGFAYMDLAADAVYSADNAILAGTGSDNPFGIGFFDYDVDGDLDYYRVTGNNGVDNVLATNSGVGASGVPEFIIAAIGAPNDDGVVDGNLGRQLALVDLDLNGRDDLLVTGGDSILYLNQNVARDVPLFVPFGPPRMFNPVPGGSQLSPATFDYDNDGDLDLFIPAWGGDACRLFRNEVRPTGSFNLVDVTTSSMTLLPGHKTGTHAGDYDNDGDLDLFVSHANSANALLRNNHINDAGAVTTGGPNFTDESSEIGPSSLTSFASYGTVWFDYDDDGDLDLLVGHDSGSARLIRNNYYEIGGMHRYVRVRVLLNGRTSPMGTKVEIVFGPHQQVQQVTSTTGFSGTPPSDLHFGTGVYETVDEIRVYVPGDVTPSIVQTDVPTTTAGAATIIINASKVY